ncbi:MAG: V-type ATP synthase subunit K [Candidatus Omnitrophica bacterium]|jgi:V/A-type H+-transporting ATPase subunit K|nr:V-type ATP synthase subunit K [Candidatus Omnitrophota bacterium]MDD3987608.1 V-type ATP synthase subunit K [Candidatus Omnitrophota bacterium]MDD4981360.1 V-type ATP synthase subunit K [Candidatus Omnitrophota bacterium]MDD5664780.1 V-type ATP synthase subunit K [Candidatus Omnitrophota bacterium]
MEIGVLSQFKDVGAAAALGLAAVGSGLGAGVAGMAVVGAWKKAFIQNKTASFMLLVFVGAPLTQTIYGMILMNKMAEAITKGVYAWDIGLFCGLAMGFSAFMQGKAGACAADAMGDTGKGFGNYLVVLGIIETVALFVMAFSLGLLGKLAK